MEAAERVNLLLVEQMELQILAAALAVVKLRAAVLVDQAW
jgi:hypothetical protein